LKALKTTLWWFLKALNVTDKTGKLIAIKAVTDDDDIMIINRSGLTIRLNVDSVRITGRATQGVKVINIAESDSIASVAKVEGGRLIEEPVEGESEVDLDVESSSEE